MSERGAAEDSDLLREYAEAGSQPAFAELVRRRIGLVYSVALRQTRGDTHRAEDATQAVFADLARKAVELSRRPVLAGWLYRSAEFAAAGIMRAERRRQQREQEAQLMDNTLGGNEPEPDWERIRPLLDRALNEMDDTDRDAILLRFFDGRPFAQIGRRLRLTENTARMRVDRALDKLQAALARHGVTSTASALGIALGQQVGAAVPAGLAVSVVGVAAASTTAGAGGLLLGFMSMTKLQVAILGTLAAAFWTGYVMQGNTNASLRREISVLDVTPQAAAALRAENQQLANMVAELEMLRRDDLELKQLEQRVATVKAAKEEARLAQARGQAARQRFYDAIRTDDERAQQEIDRLNREGNALVAEYRQLIAKSKDTTQTEQVRVEAEIAAKATLGSAQLKQQEIRTFTENVRKAFSQRIEAFRRTYGDDPSMPPPEPRAGANRVEAQRVRADASQGPGPLPSGK